MTLLHDCKEKFNVYPCFSCRLLSVRLCCISWSWQNLRLVMNITSTFFENSSHAQCTAYSKTCRKASSAEAPLGRRRTKRKGRKSAHGTMGRTFASFLLPSQRPPRALAFSLSPAPRALYSPLPNLPYSIIPRSLCRGESRKAAIWSIFWLVYDMFCVGFPIKIKWGW